MILWIVLLLLSAGACSSPPDEETGTIAQEVEITTAFAGIDLDQDGVPVGCGQPLFPLETGLNVRQTPRLLEPDPRDPFQDPVFGTCVVRVTDRRADLPSEDPSAGIKNEYSRVQAFNADGRYLIARSIDAYWYLYDANTIQPLAQLPLEDEPRWSSTDPYLIYFVSGTRLMSFNIQTGERTTVRDFEADLPFEPTMVWTRYEGSPSADGRTWGLMAEDQNWLTTAYLVYDVETDQVIATRFLDGWSEEAREIDSVTISPSGEYYLAYMDLYCEPGVLGNDANPCGLMVYDRELKNGRGLLRVVGHSDLALDTQGRDVLIYQDIDTDHIAMLELESGAITPLWSIDFSHSPIGLHFSGRAFKTPGWALISTYSGGHPDDSTWMDDQIFAVELKPNGRVMRLAHSHSVVDQDQDHDYWAEPQATVNQDFTRILFTSNWGRSGTEAVEMYMVILPPDWLEGLP
jgi:hypothetical protein